MKNKEINFTYKTYDYIGIYKHKSFSLEYFILEIDKEVETMGTNRCIRNLLRLICLLQENSVNKHCLEDGCTRPYLGPTINQICYNTRVVTLYTKNGTLLSGNYQDNGNMISSSFFRVEKVFDNCVALRVLAKDEDEYISTNSFITVNLKCICAVKCVVDTVVSNL